MSRKSDYITLARQHTTTLWNAYLELKSLQSEWSAQDYGNTLGDGEGANEGYTSTQVGAVVFATADALETLFATGHATNITDLL